MSTSTSNRLEWSLIYESMGCLCCVYTGLWMQTTLCWQCSSSEHRQWMMGSGGQAVPPAASDWKKQQFDFDVQPQNKTLDLCCYESISTRHSSKYCNWSTILIIYCSGRGILWKVALSIWNNHPGTKKVCADRKQAELWIGYTFSPQQSEKLDLKKMYGNPQWTLTPSEADIHHLCRNINIVPQ